MRAATELRVVLKTDNQSKMDGQACKNVARELIVEGGWTQNSLYDVGWSDENMCEGCEQEEGTEKHKFFHFPTCTWKEAGVKFQRRRDKSK